jgi:DNA replication and repair protein RecF
MIIDTLRVQHLRNHQDFNCTFSPNVTVITGSNGSGKTSLIEAIYLALRGTSFRATDKDVLQYDSDWWRVDVALEGGAVRSVAFDPSKQTGRKKFIVDDKTSYRLSPAHKYPAVLFEPDDLRLISGSPTRRRHFIDTLITQLDPQYSVNLRKYERALKQRNNLLKKQLVAKDDMFVWNVALSEYGAYIVSQRVHFIEQLNAKLGDAYNIIAKSSDGISVHYSDTLIGNTQQKLMSELHANYDRDNILGYTSVGPHRHDVVFRFNNIPALSAASRGEIRTIILALKFLEVAMIEQLTGQSPIVLLDDVFGELDSERQLHLAQSFRKNQTIITSTVGLPYTKDHVTIKL